MRKSRKLIAILATLALLATLLVPMVTPAAAATTYSMSNVAVMNAGTYGQIGTLSISADQSAFINSATTPSIVWLSVPSSPSGYGFGVVGAVYDGGNGSWGTPSNGVLTYNITGDTTMLPTNAGNVNNQLSGGAAKVLLQANLSDFIGDYYVKDNNGNVLQKAACFKSIKVVVNGINTSGGAAQIFLPLFVNIPSGASGDTILSAVAPASSGFSSGSIPIVHVGTGLVTLAVESTATITGATGDVSGVISVKETSQGGMTADGVKLTLPPGFTWAGENQAQSFWVYWGPGGLTKDVFDWKLSNGNRELDIIPKADSNVANLTNNSFSSFQKPVYFKFTYPIKVDESIAKTGDITVTCSGDNVTTGSLLIGSYGSYGVTMKAVGTPPAITAGKAGVKLGKFEVDETVKGSLVDKRTITLTLPAGLVWDKNNLPQVDTANSSMYGVNTNFNWVSVGSDGREIKGTFNIAGGSTTDAAKIVFKDAEVECAVDFSGDVNVTVGGTEGLSGTLTLAKVTSPITAAVESTPNVKIGMAGQAIGNVTITESAAGNLDAAITYAALDTYAASGSPSYLGITDSGPNSGAQLVLTAPSGVKFDTVPTVTVTSGDLQLDTSNITITTTTNNEGQVIIPIKSSSTTPSTIKVSNMVVTVDRTVPEGPIALKVQGTAVNENTFKAGSTIEPNDSVLFPNSDTAAKVTVANCVTPAPGEQKPAGKVVFTINDTKFKVGDKEQTMDVAPYIKDGRTFIPVRYAAMAVGVTPENILYSDGKVTLIKGDKVVQLTIGSNVMLINGIAINMDVAAEISNDRTMLPFRWVAQALGAKVNWDEATQTVTMEM